MLKWKGNKKSEIDEPVAFASGSDVGKCREENQDSYCLVSGENFGFLAVADGMGGKPGGASASSIAIQVFAQRLAACSLLSEEFLSNVFHEANQRILLEAAKNKGFAGMGTTFTGLAFQGSNMFLTNIGDSRIYRMREGKLVQLSTDHTVVAELVRSKTITEEQALNNPMAHMLSRALGSASNSEVDCFKLKEAPKAGDIYLLCSDGLYNYLSSEEITKILQRYDPQEAVDTLIEMVNERGGHDNITALAAAFTDLFDNIESAECTQEDIKKRRILVSCAQLLPEVSTEGIDLPALEENLQKGVLEAAVKRTHGRAMTFIVSLASIVVIMTGAGIWLKDSGVSRSDNLGKSIKLNDPTQPFLQTDPKLRITFGEITKALSLPYAKDLLNPSGAESFSEKEVFGSAKMELDSQLSEEQLQERLKQIRSRIDVETRKLALWYERRRIFKLEPNLELAAAVAVTSKKVDANRDKFDRANQVYLKEAEALLYNPADPEQEREVSKLSKEREKRLKVLNDSVEIAIEKTVGSSLQNILDLAIQRDRTMRQLRQRS